jgi:hypothetical protein
MGIGQCECTYWFNLVYRLTPHQLLCLWKEAFGMIGKLKGTIRVMMAKREGRKQNKKKIQ